MKVLLMGAGAAFAAAAAFAPAAQAQVFDPVPDPGQERFWAQDANALTPYSAWMSVSRDQAMAASGQARNAASAFENALSATVDPHTVAANRNLLANLIATNFLGQNTPAINQPMGNGQVFDPVPEPTAPRAGAER